MRLLSLYTLNPGFAFHCIGAQRPCNAPCPKASCNNEIMQVHNVTYTLSKILHLPYFHRPPSCWEPFKERGGAVDENNPNRGHETKYAVNQKHFNASGFTCVIEKYVFTNNTLQNDI